MKIENKTIIMIITILLYIISMGVSIYLIVSSLEGRESDPIDVAAGIYAKQTDTMDQKLINLKFRSSYNTCCRGPFTGRVEYNGINNAINLGARMLHFSIYSIDGNAVVAANTFDDELLIGTENSLPIDDVLNRINEEYPSPGPFFLHFRMITKLHSVINDLSTKIKKNFNTKLLDGYSVLDLINKGGDEGVFPYTTIEKIRGKIIIIYSMGDNWTSIEKQNIFKESRLDKNNSFLNIVNLYPGLSRKFEIIKESDLIKITEGKACRDILTIVLPDNGSEKSKQFSSAHRESAIVLSGNKTNTWDWTKGVIASGSYDKSYDGEGSDNVFLELSDCPYGTVTVNRLNGPTNGEIIAAASGDTKLP